MKSLINIVFLVVPGMVALGACRLRQSHRAELPSFNLLLPDSVTIFNTASMEGGKPSLFIFFSPDCEHCQEETISIIKHMDELKDVNLCFVTIDPFVQMKSFVKFYKIARYPNVVIGRDYTYYFADHYKINTTPYMVLFDYDKKQRAIFAGEVAISQIIAYINQL